MGPAEAWRVKLFDATLICYQNGTIYSTPSQQSAVERAWDFIETRWPRYVPTERAFLIGLDEAGKGELVGHLTLAGAFIPVGLMSELQEVIGPADTKKRHSPAYWDAVFARLQPLRRRGLDFVTEK